MKPRIPDERRLFVCLPNPDKKLTVDQALHEAGKKLVDQFVDSATLDPNAPKRPREYPGEWDDDPPPEAA